MQDSFPLGMSIPGTCRKINLGGKNYEKMEKKNGGVEFGVGTDDGDDIDGQCRVGNSSDRFDFWVCIEGNFGCDSIVCKSCLYWGRRDL